MAMGTIDGAPCRAIERQISTEYGRDKLAKALYEVIVDGLAFGPRELSTPDDRDWIRGAIAMPIQETTDVALHVLAWRIAQVLERAPDGLKDRLRSSPRWVELGWG
jgi:hypothetical protein